MGPTRYFVGHVDEMKNDFWIWKQELIFPVGHHHLTVTKEGKTVWEGDVDVQANKKTYVDMSKNSQKTTEWPRGTKLKGLPRFKPGRRAPRCRRSRNGKLLRVRFPDQLRRYV